ncbi:hypothetical protein KQE47_26610, partial [Raoultella planticola]|nr:hypothetical protein [Raoultella planticola]
HSAVVVVLAAVGMWVGREAFTDEAMYWLQLASGGVVVLLGGYLLYRRWPKARPLAGPDHPHPHHHAPEPFRFAGERAAGT